VALDDKDLDAAAGQQAGEREPGRAGADHDDRPMCARRHDGPGRQRSDTARCRTRGASHIARYGQGTAPEPADRDEADQYRVPPEPETSAVTSAAPSVTARPSPPPRTPRSAAGRESRPAPAIRTRRVR